MIDDPKTAAAGLVAGAAATTAAWDGALAIFAETTWPDVARDFVAVLSAFVIGYWAWKSKQVAGEAKQAAGETKSTVIAAAATLNSKADEAKDHAAAAAKLARTAAQVAVKSDQKADKRGEMLADVARHTNGEYAALKAERDELRRWKEAQLAAQMPPGSTDAIAHLTDAVEEASKSGVFKRPDLSKPSEGKS